MTDETRDPAGSTGSVAGEPVAWGIQFWGGDLHHEVFDTREKAEREMYRGSPPGVCTARVVSLHLTPTLTDAERTEIRRLIEDYEQDGEPASQRCVDTLRGLLERTK